MPDNSKPILTAREQVEHLKQKGVKFNVMSEADAERYLTYQSNYFKVTAYRKNYPKHTDGENAGKYINLEFAYLVDLATIDMHLRYQLVHMALDIEHHVKLQLLRALEAHGEDGYSIVSDYMHSLSPQQQNTFQSEINRNNNNVYCGDIVQKYGSGFPVWALIEIIPFGRLVSFYKFSASRFNDTSMMKNFYLLLTCKEIRNATAHSNCILNDLRANTTNRKADKTVSNALTATNGITAGSRRNRMSNARIQQIVTLFYEYKMIVSSDALRKREEIKLHAVKDRMLAHIEYYGDNSLISDTFSFLETLIDNWF